MNNPKFQISKSDRNAQFFYHLRATNGEIILSGEDYTTKQSCQTGIASVKANAPDDARYEKHDAAGNYTFNLKAANGEIIGPQRELHHGRRPRQRHRGRQEGRAHCRH